MRKKFIWWSDGKSKRDGPDSAPVPSSLPPVWERYFCLWQDCMGELWWNKARTGHVMQMLHPAEPSSFGKCFLFKSQWMFNERLKMHTHTVSDTLHGAHLLGSPDYSFCYTWPEARLRTWWTEPLPQGCYLTWMCSFSLSSHCLSTENMQRRLTICILCS